MFSLFKTAYKFTSDFNKIVYVHGKSLISLSQMIGENGQYIDPHLNNFYIKEHTEHEFKHQKKIQPETLQNQAKLLQTVLEKDLIARCILTPEISKKQMNLNINKLKKSPLLNHIIQLRQKTQFKSNTPIILINSYMHADQAREILQECEYEGIPIKQSQLPVHKAMHGKDKIPEQVWVDKEHLVQQVEERIKKNIVELEKLFNDGLGLNLSFMISKRNLHEVAHQEKKISNFWLNCIQKKSKGIHSNIVQNGIPFADTVYSQGHQLHHIFLSSYNQKKERVSLMQQNKSYKMQESIYVLRLIDFKGKLVIDSQDPESFNRNAQFLDGVMKDVGYKKTNIDEIDDDSYISAL